MSVARHMIRTTTLLVEIYIYIYSDMMGRQTLPEQKMELVIDRILVVAGSTSAVNVLMRNRCVL